MGRKRLERDRRFINSLMACSFLMAGNFLFGQHALSGKLTDSLAKPIENVSILLFDQEKLVKFTNSGPRGEYEFEDLTEGKYKIEISSMFYKAQPKHIVLNRDETLNFLLKEKLTTIDEVVIDIERDIEVKGDTIIFRADAFNRKKNVVVEDLLQNIPGIEIRDDGLITFQGKTVTNVKVDNDDLFQGGYAVLTKNLNAAVVDKVQVLQNYSRNPLLKNVRDTEDVALNLSLKDDRKANFFGNIETGISDKGHYDVKGNNISLLQKSKHYLFLDFNNIGRDVVSDINGILSNRNDDFSYEVGRREGTPTFVNLNTNRPIFNDKFVNFNNSKFLNLNSIYSISETAKLSTTGILFSDGKDFISKNVTNFLVEDPFVLTEDFLTRINDRLGLAKVNFEWDVSDDSRFEYISSYFNLHTTGNSSLAQNGIDITEDLKTKLDRQNHFLHFTKKISDSTAFVLSGRYIDETKPQSYMVEPYIYGEYFKPEEEVESFIKSYASVSDRMKVTSAQFGLYHNTSKANWESYLGVKNRKDQLESTLNLINEGSEETASNEDFFNDLDFESNLVYFNNRFRRTFNKINFFANLDFNYEVIAFDGISRNAKKDYFFIDTSLNMKYTPNKNHEVISGFQINKNTSEVKHIIPNYVQYNYRSFVKGSGDINLLKSSGFYLNYRYGNWSDEFTANLNASFTHNHNFLSSASMVAVDINTIQQTVLEDSNQFSINFSSDRFLDLLSSNLKLKVDYFSHNYSDFVNDISRSIKSSQASYGVELRSVFTGAFNLNAGTEWNRISYDINGSYSKNTNNKTFLDLDINLDEDFQISVMNERYQFGNLPKGSNAYYFTNMDTQYFIKDSNFSFFLRVNNLFDNKSFDLYSLTDITEFQSSTRLIPRYVMLGLNYRF